MRDDRGLRIADKSPRKTLRFPVPVIDPIAGSRGPSAIRGRPQGSPQSRTYLLAFPVIAILLWAVVYPNVSVIAGSLADGARAWKEFFASPADREAVVSTLIVSVGSVIAAT